jgi:4-aminobutyrate aminotransferase-like enzyme
VRMLPPFVVSPDNIDEAVATLDRVLTEVAS